ncbi:hypothetical protein [Acetomicrobium hydrogeniformans]|uniref:Uncharacterized protein n=1 Tax=Acetomicrobium hydrogeniformans ATCC BAA-1850 TaxID=592015 RepID=A0A0T5XDI4_9BACT|nr:hypothetical protein [Acetomicrobium hydrogeniformans]KRT36440.1 hypothetical protein HMPREF1705_03725 [Acetomicrobium hydrogeniformans ATCC BAA-1850]
MKFGMKAAYLLFAAFVVVLFANPAFAAMGEIQSFTFKGTETDLLGMKETLKPDGKPDAHFVVSLKGVGAITGVELKAIGTDRAWDTIPGNEKWGMIVRDGKGEDITTASGSFSTKPFFAFLTLHLYVADDGTAFSEKREYEVSVSFMDGSAVTAKTTVPGLPESEELSAVLLGIGDKDVVGKSEKINRDGVRDAHFKTRFNTVSVVEEISIRNVDGTSSAWDTAPGNGIWAIAVYTDGKLRNREDGSVKFAVEGDTTLDLWVADNGSIAAGATRYEVIVKFNDGTVLRKVAERQEVAKTAVDKGILSAVLIEPTRGDLTSRSEALKGDGKPDWKIAIEMVAEGRIINFIVRGNDSASEWDTIPGNGKWLVAVTDSSGNVLNESNGSISLNVSGKKEFDLWLTDNGTITEGDVKYKVLVVMSDGSILEKDVVRAEEGKEVSKAGMPSDRAQVSDKIRATYRGKGPMNYLKKAEVSSLLASADANPDAHMLLKLINTKGTIKSITVKAKDGKSGTWDTIPGNGVWNIVVTRAASGGILSNTDGSFNMEVERNTELHLWLADNGNFGVAPEKFEIFIAFEDGRLLKNTIRK